MSQDLKREREFASTLDQDKAIADNATIADMLRGIANFTEWHKAPYDSAAVEDFRINREWHKGYRLTLDHTARLEHLVQLIDAVREGELFASQWLYNEKPSMVVELHGWYHGRRIKISLYPFGRQLNALLQRADGLRDAPAHELVAVPRHIAEAITVAETVTS